MQEIGTMTTTRYTHRHIVRLTVEAATPLAVGTGKGSDILTDAPVAKDVNGLPYIPATSIAGVLRHAMGYIDNKTDGNPFGYIDGADNDDSGHGSDIIFTDAVIVGKDGKALDGIQNIDWDDEFYRAFQDLPIRQHVRINDKGTADNKNNGKFDNEVVYKGTRFVFEIELMSDSDDKDSADKHITDAINRLRYCTLRIGGGTRKGYGKLKIIKCLKASLDLSTPEDLEKYLKKSSSLAEDWDGFTEVSEIESLDDSKWTHYQLKLKPLDFFMFGSGMGDSDADNVYVSELVVSQGESIDNNKRVLIPGSSVKGAIAHRTAYHYNKIKKRFAGEQKPEDITGCNNEAVAAIFGKADGDKFTRGRILIDDIIKGQVKAEADADAGEKATPTAKTFFHNKIDQFTGGTMDGALFQEKVIYDKGTEYTFDIYVENSALADDDIEKAFEQSLHDICTGLLPLGGITNRGNGIFTGTATKDNKPLWTE